jgi:hypothetical protein
MIRFPFRVSDPVVGLSSRHTNSDIFSRPAIAAAF